MTYYDQPRPRVVIEQESRSMEALRALTYVLCSLAALTFLILVIYGYMQVREWQAALEQLPFGAAPTPEPPPFPG